MRQIWKYMHITNNIYMKWLTIKQCKHRIEIIIEQLQFYVFVSSSTYTDNFYSSCYDLHESHAKMAIIIFWDLLRVTLGSLWSILQGTSLAQIQMPHSRMVNRT